MECPVVLRACGALCHFRLVVQQSPGYLTRRRAAGQHLRHDRANSAGQIRITASMHQLPAACIALQMAQGMLDVRITWVEKG